MLASPAPAFVAAAAAPIAAGADYFVAAAVAPPRGRARLRRRLQARAAAPVLLQGHPPCACLPCTRGSRVACRHGRAPASLITFSGIRAQQLQRHRPPAIVVAAPVPAMRAAVARRAIWPDDRPAPEKAQRVQETSIAARDAHEASSSAELDAAKPTHKSSQPQLRRGTHLGSSPGCVPQLAPRPPLPSPNLTPAHAPWAHCQSVPLQRSRGGQRR